ncbi:LTA synthase family protein [Helicobacter felis]|uniref:LTA synthase family protein n=1 Tax=Helicobacter felis TaxID=214 RepID=UPI000CEE70F5|nr:alkaline phosphatase family protein [Helicobacter felis]
MRVVFSSSKRGQQFLTLVLDTLVFSLFCTAFFILMRLGFIAYMGIYKGALVHASAHLDQIGQVLVSGLKYDNRIVAALGLIYLLLGLLSPFKIRPKVLRGFAYFALSLCLFLQIANITFYGIYGDVFDSNLLQIFTESPKVILGMAFTGEYFIGTKFLIWLLLSVASAYLYRVLQPSYTLILALPLKWTLSGAMCALALFMLVSINSRLALTGVSLDFIAHSVQNPFLRQITPGAFRDLYLVFKDYRKSHHVHFSDFTSKTPLQTGIDYFNLPKDTKTPLDLYKLLTHTSQNPKPPTITHVFYIVSESLSSWHFDPQFDSIGLTSALKSLNDGQHGFIFPLFLENAKRTVKSLDVQITGLFNINDTNFVNMGVNIPSLPTAIGNQMKNLGFENTFYYGGSGIWNRLDRFTKKQGFAHFIFNTYLLDFAKGQLKINPKAYPQPLESNWGVHDNILFDYILKNTPINKKTFSMVMTLSNHPTRNVNLKAFGVPVEKIENFVKNSNDKNMPSANFLGHIFWYDKILVDFIKKASAKFPNALFIITGDHFDRSFTLAKDNYFWTKSVPLILYAPSLNPKLATCIGSHIDIPATIMELVAPKDYEYVSFGKPLFSNEDSSQNCEQRKPFVWGQSKNFALGFDVVGAQSQTSKLDFLYMENAPLLYVKDHQRTKGANLPADLQLGKELTDKMQIANGLSWYLLFKGRVINP